MELKKKSSTFFSSVKEEISPTEQETRTLTYNDKKTSLYSKTLFTKIYAPLCSLQHYSWRQQKCPLIENWIKKMLYVYSMECPSVIRKDEMLIFATTWVDLENIMLSEMSVS